MKRTKSLIFFLVFFAIFCLADRVAKIFVTNNSIDAYDWGILRLNLVHNSGAAFGIGQGNSQIFLIIAAVVFVIILLWILFVQYHGKLEMFSLALVAAGAVGNAIDRMLFGYVIDYLQITLFSFPVFNIADACVVIGFILLIVSILFCSPKKNVANQKD